MITNIRPYLLLFILGSFPFINFGTNYDYLPIFLFSTFLVSLSKNIDIRFFYGLIYIIILFTIVSLISIERFDQFLFLRGILNHSASVAALIVAYNITIKEKNLVKLIKIINIIYLVTALIQLEFPNAFEFLINSRSGAGRGLNSLTSEPSFFGIVLVVFTALYLRENKFSGKFILISLNLITLFFIAKSALGVLLLTIIISTYLFDVIRIKVFFIIIIMSIIALNPYSLSFLSEFFSGTRIDKIFNLITNYNFSDILAIDSSIQGRFSHLLCSSIMSFSNFGLPNGFFAFSDAYADCNMYIFQNNLTRETSPKIMSMFGSILFDMGPIFLSLLIFILFKGRLSRISSLRQVFIFFLISFMAFSPFFVPLYLLLFNRNLKK